MSDTTTIKVTKMLRDRISADAAQENKTVSQFLEVVVDRYERARRMSLVAVAYAEADSAELAGWRGETQAWEAIDPATDVPR